MFFQTARAACCCLLWEGVLFCLCRLPVCLPAAPARLLLCVWGEGTILLSACLCVPCACLCVPVCLPAVCLPAAPARLLCLCVCGEGAILLSACLPACLLLLRAAACFCLQRVSAAVGAGPPAALDSPAQAGAMQCMLLPRIIQLLQCAGSRSASMASTHSSLQQIACVCGRAQRMLKTFTQLLSCVARLATPRTHWYPAVSLGGCRGR